MRLLKGKKQKVATDLISLAQKASQNAYVPYSHFPIGAAVKTKSGDIYLGCNIENASFGLTNCGERTAIFKAISEGHRDFEEIAVYGETEDPISPCGACRQVMAEFFEPTARVTLVAKDGKTVVMTVDELLPYSFTELR
ncbi:cytidine deaminase [Streptococcus ratti]|nr:cytidine deaminase [Streptococcus ratti]